MRESKIDGKLVPGDIAIDVSLLGAKPVPYEYHNNQDYWLVVHGLTVTSGHGRFQVDIYNNLQNHYQTVPVEDSLLFGTGKLPGRLSFPLCIPPDGWLYLKITDQSGLFPNAFQINLAATKHIGSVPAVGLVRYGTDPATGKKASSTRETRDQWYILNGEIVNLAAGDSDILRLRTPDDAAFCIATLRAYASETAAGGFRAYVKDWAREWSPAHVNFENGWGDAQYPKKLNRIRVCPKGQKIEVYVQNLEGVQQTSIQFAFEGFKRFAD